MGFLILGSVPSFSLIEGYYSGKNAFFLVFSAPFLEFPGTRGWELGVAFWGAAWLLLHAPCSYAEGWRQIMPWENTFLCIWRGHHGRQWSWNGLDLGNTRKSMCGLRDFGAGPLTTYIRTFPLLWWDAARLCQEADMFILFSVVTIVPGRVANTLICFKKKKKRKNGALAGGIFFEEWLQGSTENICLCWKCQPRPRRRHVAECGYIISTLG